MSQLAVVIPTHRRPAILRQTLEHLSRQTIAQDLEVMVVSDGPDAETAAMVTTSTWPMHVQYWDIPKSQQGVARNAGVERVSTPFVLFIGDDIFLEPTTCATHLRVLKTHQNQAVLGYTAWDPACGITPVMHWLDRTGWQFGYGLIRQYGGNTLPQAHQHWYTYTSHLSLPTDIARSIRFRDDVTGYGWEDVEWGLRLAQAGIRLRYEPTAVGRHHHHLEMADSLIRMRKIGSGATMMQAKNPALQVVPTGLRLLKYRLQAVLPTLSGRHARAFLAGLDSK